MDIFLFLIGFVFLIFCSGFFSASETALFSLSTIKVKAYQNDPNPRRQLIARLVLQPRDLLVTVFMLNTLVNILIQNLFSSMFGAEASWLLKVVLPMVSTLVIGEIIPKYIGLQYNVSLSYNVAPLIDLLQNVLKPIRKFVIAVTLPISRVMFFFLKKEESISKEELQHVLKKSQEHGVLLPEEAEMVWGYLSLQESSVKELMNPREDMLAYDILEPLSKLLYLFGEKKQVEVAVYEKDLDNIIGIISAKEYLLSQNELSQSQDLRKILKRPLYIPENTPARSLLRRLEEQHQALAIVVDEYGTTSGIIAKNDILALVVGVTEEEKDKNTLYTRSGKNEIIASGKLELSTFNELFDVELESDNNMVTIGGWLMEQMGDIPKSGTKYTTKDFLFHVLAAEPNRVRRIYIRKITNPGLKKIIKRAKDNV